MYDKELKERVKGYYKSHVDDVSTICSIFKGLNERTLRHWIQSEKWIKGRLLNEISAKDIVNMWTNIQQSLYGKEREGHVMMVNNISTDLANMSMQQLENALCALKTQ